MKVLIVQSDAELGVVWRDHLIRQGAEAVLVGSASAAARYLQNGRAEVIVLDLVLKDGSALALADLARYKDPASKVIFVTNSTFFSDGSIFAHIPNAAALLPSDTSPEDLSALVEYHGR